MRAATDKNDRKRRRKVLLEKASASEILSGVHVSSRERQHAKRAVAIAQAANGLPAPDLPRGTSEFRVGDRRAIKHPKSKTK